MIIHKTFNARDNVDTLYVSKKKEEEDTPA